MPTYERRSALTGKTDTIEIDATHEAMEGSMAGHMTPSDLRLTVDEGAFLLSGTTAEERALHDRAAEQRRMAASAQHRG